MKVNNGKLIAALAVNILIVLMEVISAVIGFLLRWDEYKLKALFFYTQDSNLFALVACTLLAVSEIECLIEKRNSPSKTSLIMKYMASSTLSLTFLVVLFVLIPLAGWSSFSEKLFQDTKLYHHFLCPLFVTFSFIYLDDFCNLKPKYACFAFIPTVCYAVILTLLNILKVVEGPYPYLRVYNQPLYMSLLWSVVILSASYIISRGLLIWKRHTMKGEER